MSPQLSVYAKWFANVCYVLATVSLLSPMIASQALFPWIAYLLGNAVWMSDSYTYKNWAWFWLAVFFCVWDVLLIVTRLFGLQFFSILEPFVTLLEKLP